MMCTFLMDTIYKYSLRTSGFWTEICPDIKNDDFHNLLTKI